MKITIYSDRGHGWAKVKKHFLYKLGIADKISPYSYMRGEYAYLEEDCDLSTLCRALDQNKIVFSFDQRKPSDNQSKIRSYDQYKDERQSLIAMFEAVSSESIENQLSILN